MSVEAIDPDYNPETNVGGITYAITGGQDILKMDPNTGEITLVQDAMTVPEDKLTFRIILSVFFIIGISFHFFSGGPNWTICAT